MSCELWNSRALQHGKRRADNLYRARKLAFDERDDHCNVHDGFDEVRFGYYLGYGNHSDCCAFSGIGALRRNSEVHCHSQQRFEQWRS